MSRWTHGMTKMDGEAKHARSDSSVSAYGARDMLTRGGISYAVSCYDAGLRLRIAF